MDAHAKAAEALARGEDARRDKRLPDAKLAFAEAVGLFRQFGLPERLAHSLTRSAQIARDTGTFDEARRDQEEALAIYRQLGDRDALPHASRHLADILQDAGRHEEADPHYGEMLALYRARSDTPPLEMANAIRSAARHAEHMGDKEAARRLWTEARDRYAALDELFLELTGSRENPGVRGSRARLAKLGPPR
jgi:tetratricopeptide (TPR) repeat protein